MIKMTQSQFSAFYKKQLESLRAECDEMVRNGECDQEYADFRYYMVMDEIIWASEGDIEIIPDEEGPENGTTDK